jgi:hypothetical protein
MIGWLACVLAQAAAPQPAPLQTALPPGATAVVRAAARPLIIPALEAGLGNVRGLALDGLGGVYVTSEELGLVFRVEPAGSLTIVGGRVRQPHERGWDDGTIRTDQVQPAVAVGLMAPVGLALDRQHRLLVADRVARRIRRIDLASGLIETVAGADGDGHSLDQTAREVDATDPAGHPIGDEEPLLTVECEASRGHERNRDRRLDFVGPDRAIVQAALVRLPNPAAHDRQ